jgi:cobalamin synthase
MKNLPEIAFSSALLLVILLKIDPLHWFMPTALQMLLLAVLTAGMAIYVGIIYRERARDERERDHLYRASRAGYLVGVIALSALVVVQDLRHELDPLVLIVLALMILTKLAVLKFNQYRR